MDKWEIANRISDQTFNSLTSGRSEDEYMMVFQAVVTRLTGSLTLSRNLSMLAKEFNKHISTMKEADDAHEYLQAVARTNTFSLRERKELFQDLGVCAVVDRVKGLGAATAAARGYLGVCAVVCIGGVEA